MQGGSLQLHPDRLAERHRAALRHAKAYRPRSPSLTPAPLADLEIFGANSSSACDGRDRPHTLLGDRCSRKLGVTPV